VIILMGLALILVVMTLAVLMDSMVEDLTVSRKCAIEGVALESPYSAAVSAATISHCN
jgi:hypothetical protein